MSRPKFSSMSFISSGYLLKRKQSIKLHSKINSAHSVKSRKPNSKLTCHHPDSFLFPEYKSKPGNPAVELQTVNEHLVKNVGQYKRKCETEMNRIQKQIEETKEHTYNSIPKSFSMNKGYIDQIELLRDQLDAHKYELQRKDLNCRDEVKKLSKALKNVQNKNLMLQMKYHNLNRKTLQYQTKMHQLQDLNEKKFTEIEELKATNFNLKQELLEKHEKEKTKIKPSIVKAKKIHFCKKTQTAQINENPIVSPPKPEIFEEVNPELEELISFEIKTKDGNLSKVFHNPI